MHGSAHPSLVRPTPNCSVELNRRQTQPNILACPAQYHRSSSPVTVAA